MVTTGVDTNTARTWFYNYMASVGVDAHIDPHRFVIVNSERNYCDDEDDEDAKICEKLPIDSRN